MNTLKVYSAFKYEPAIFEKQNIFYQFDLKYCFEPLSDLNLPKIGETKALCLFVSDQVDRQRMKELKSRGIEALFLRSKGFDHVDMVAAQEFGITIIPTEYDTCAVVEHTLGLLIALARNFKKSFEQTSQGDFSIENLLGIELHDKVAGVVGTGKIGRKVIEALMALGMHILAYDLFPDPKLAHTGVRYVSMETLLRLSDVVTLHNPLTPETHHLINAENLSLMQPQALLVNTARGGLVDTQAVLDALNREALAGFACDVYEKEQPFFFGKKTRPLSDPVLEALLNHPKVLLTGHEGFLSDQSVEVLIGNCLQNFDKWLTQQGSTAQTSMVS